MPVIAHCEKGLIIDVFGEKPTILKCDLYKTSNNQAAIVYKNTLKFMDLNARTLQSEQTVPLVTDLHISSDGSKVAVVTCSKTLIVFRNCKKIAEIEDVEECSVSDTFYCVRTKESTRIFSIDTNQVLLEVKDAVKTIHALNTIVILITERIESQSVIVFKNGTITRILELPSIYRSAVKHNQSENRILLLLDTEYTKTSYYADSTLYLLCYPKFGDIKEPEKEAKDAQKAVLIKKTDGFQLFTYPSLLKIHSVGFLKSSFYVCFGDQPASLYRFNLDGSLQEKYPRAIRNAVVFNRKENRVINCGFGNLPGNIKVYNAGETGCTFELLGSSVASWMNNDCQFMVAITNYFKSDNKVVIYDYYGKIYEEMECKSLESACVYGFPESEIDIPRPESILKPKKVAAYVPPHLQRSTAPAGNSKPKLETRKKAHKREKNVIENELQECYELRKKLQAGEELTLEEENRVFQIKALEEELSKLD